MDLFLKLVFLCPMLFIAGIVDGVSGGGGIIALPAYLMTGMPVTAAYGCNKMQSCIGTGASLFRYAKSGYVDVRAALFSAVAAIVGSYVSTQIMLSLSESTVKLIIAAAMCFIITLTLIINKVASGENTRIHMTVKTVLQCFGIGLILGLYDGFFGPGGGTIALMLFSMIFKYNVCTASGNGKLIIVVSNFSALVNYIINGSVLYEYAIPATIANILGSYIGASLAVKNGKKIVKKFMLAVVVMLVGQAVLKLL